MKEKIVPYGETHPVEVISVSPQVLAVKGLDNNEGYIMIGWDTKNWPNKGDKGKIVFERGGPKKGHWQYYPE